MNISTIVTADVQGYIQGYRVAQLVNCLGTSGYRHYQSNEASILWSYHEETRELPEERNNARNNARCTQARKTTHGLDRHHQDTWTGLPVEESMRMTEDRDK